MNSQIQQALCDQFAQIDSVRSAKPREDFVAVHTWSGVVIHVYLLDEPIKARTVKRIVQDNTRVGVGTLFIASLQIVPEDGARVEVDEGLLALHALFKDKLYTYRRQDSAMVIGQVHFKALGRGDEYEVWYGPDVIIKHLPSYRVWVSAPQTIKGNWLIANFGSDAFWKQADYSAGRDAFRREQNRTAGKSKFQFWSKPGWYDAGGAASYEAASSAPPASPPSRPTPETELDRSYKQLGLAHDASGDEVKAAFRRLALEVHPDTSKLPKAEAEARFKKIYAAYATIKAAKGW